MDHGDPPCRAKEKKKRVIVCSEAWSLSSWESHGSPPCTRKSEEALGEVADDGFLD